jgi:hypothetical protein
MPGPWGHDVEASFSGLVDSWSCSMGIDYRNRPFSHSERHRIVRTMTSWSSWGRPMARLGGFRCLAYCPFTGVKFSIRCAAFLSV